MSLLFTKSGAYLPVAERTCARCAHVLVGEDELGPYYQIPVTENTGPLSPGGPDTVLTFADRVHECDGKPHELPGKPAVSLTRTQIEGIQDKAAREGPAELVFLCQMALEGDSDAWRAVTLLHKSGEC